MSPPPPACCCCSCAGVLWQQHHMCPCGNKWDPMMNPKGCKRHKPDGCLAASKEAGTRLQYCPLCLMLPVLTLLRKV